MRCIYCDGKTSVVDTRESDHRVRRRRECKECGKRFTTYEEAESIETLVKKSDGTLEAFDEEKLRSGIQKAAKNTSVDRRDINRIIDAVREKVKGLKEVKSGEIGDIVMEELKNIDGIAYIRFASVYDEFESFEALKKEVEELKE